MSTIRPERLRHTTERERAYMRGASLPPLSGSPLPLLPWNTRGAYAAGLPIVWHVHQISHGSGLFAAATVQRPNIPYRHTRYLMSVCCKLGREFERSIVGAFGGVLPPKESSRYSSLTEGFLTGRRFGLFPRESEPGEADRGEADRGEAERGIGSDDATETAASGWQRCVR